MNPSDPIQMALWLNAINASNSQAANIPADAPLWFIITMLVLIGLSIAGSIAIIVKEVIALWGWNPPRPPRS